MANDIRVPINSDADIVTARQQGRAFAAELGFSGSDLTLIATAISEVARNIVEYAQRGEIVFGRIQQGSKSGIVVIARDEGPGILDVEQVKQGGYAKGKGLGLGLAGSRRLMDELEIISEVGKGTTVLMKKWLY